MKKIVSLILALSILSSTVLATSESALKNNLSNTNQEISETKKELTSVQNDKKLTLKDIDNLDKQIETKESEIAYLENDIATLEKNIVVAEENIQYSVEQYEKKDLLRQERLVAYYKCGDLSFWDTLLASESITDFFYRYRLLNSIIDYDNQLLTELEEQRIEIENQKVELENNKVLCEEKKATAEEQKIALGDVKEVRVTYLAKLEKTEDLLEESIDELQKKADELTKELQKLASSSTTSKYTGGTMTWPLPGFYSITSPYGNRLHPVLKVYKMHTGVDIAGGGCNGKNVVAAADGTVITANETEISDGSTIQIAEGGSLTISGSVVDYYGCYIYVDDEEVYYAYTDTFEYTLDNINGDHTIYISIYYIY